MKKIALVICLLIIAGCTSGENSNGNSKEEDFRTGTDGLAMSFFSGVPPDRILSSSPLSVMVEINNKGAYNIENGQVYLSGYDKRYVYGTDQVEKKFSLEGKSRFNPDGTLKDIIEFKDDTIENVPKDISSLSQMLKATACYYYETLANPEVCINPEQYTSSAGTPVCSLHTVSLSGGQGAPVEVTKVEEELMDKKIVLKIYIRNSGRGTPFVADRTNCHTSLKFNDVGVVSIKEVKFSDFDLTASCRNNPIRLQEDNTGFFICSSELSGLGKNAYVTPLRIRLGYNYRETITRSFEIINS